MGTACGGVPTYRVVSNWRWMRPSLGVTVPISCLALPALSPFLLELFPPPGLPSSLLLVPLKSFKPNTNVFLKSDVTAVFLGPSQSNSSFPLLPQHVAHQPITKGQKTTVESMHALASDRPGFASQLC